MRRPCVRGSLRLPRLFAPTSPTRGASVVSQDRKDPRASATYERFTDQAAVDKHNSSEAVARFLRMAKPILDGEVILVTCPEILEK